MNRETRQRLRQQQAQDRLKTAASAPAAPQAKAEPPAEPPAKEKEKLPKVKFLCGHEGYLPLCGQCKNERARAERESRQKKQEAAGQDGKPLHGKKNFEQKGRLPHGSAFLEPTWDATRGLWAGGLRIGPPGKDGPVFHAEASGIVPLCFALDEMYRKSLEAKS